MYLFHEGKDSFFLNVTDTYACFLLLCRKVQDKHILFGMILDHLPKDCSCYIAKSCLSKHICYVIKVHLQSTVHAATDLGGKQP